MESEFQTLNSIDKNNNFTQRDIAKHTGMSLGNVNIIIKRLAKKGLIKVEHLNTKTIRYILTPKGIKEKADISYWYITSSFKRINEINFKLDEFLNSSVFQSIKIVVLFGNDDEILQMLKDKLNGKKLLFQYIDPNKMPDNEFIIKEDKLVYCREDLGEINKYLIITWHSDYSEILTNKGLKYINLMEVI
jgi:DNA-binding MarR family transcriptional regulator